MTDAEIVEIQGFHKFCDAPCRYDADCDRTHEGLFRVLNTLLETRAALRCYLTRDDVDWQIQVTQREARCSCPLCDEARRVLGEA